MGDAIHSFTQGLIAAELGQRERLAFRTLIAPRAGAPDVYVVALPQMETPHLVVEVLSPQDQGAEVLAKLADYQAAGIPHVWLVDPYKRQLFDCSDGRIVRSDAPILSTPLVGEVDFAALFAQLDETTS